MLILIDNSVLLKLWILNLNFTLRQQLRRWWTIIKLHRQEETGEERCKEDNCNKSRFFQKETRFFLIVKINILLKWTHIINTLFTFFFFFFLQKWRKKARMMNPWLTWWKRRVEQANRQRPKQRPQLQRRRTWCPDQVKTRKQERHQSQVTLTQI